MSPCAPSFARRWLCSSQLDGSFLAPLLCPVALDISSRPSSARQLPMAPCTFVFNPATFNPPLCWCAIVTFDRALSICALPSVWWTRALKEALQSRMTSHLFCTTKCSLSFVFLLFVYPHWFPSHLLPLGHLLLSLPPAFSFPRIRAHGTSEQCEPFLLWAMW